jgi:putative transposase
MKLNKAYKFRLYPNKKQSILLNKTIGCARFIYNQMLADKIKHYEKTKEKLKNTPAQYKKEFEWLKEVDSLALANSQQNLKTAYNNFFRNPKKVGFPKFKSKRKTKKSYTKNNQKGRIRLSKDKRKLKLPKVGFIKVVAHRKNNKNETIKSCTITQKPSGKYYVSIIVEFELEIKQKEITEESQVLGLDFSMSNFYHSSEDKKANYPKYYRESLEKLAKVQRSLSRKVKGSQNYKKQKIKAAKLHEKIANQRKDFLHKESRKLVNQYTVIVIEDLDMKAMSQCLNFGKSVHDNGWGVFINLLKYKLEWEGKQLIKIDKWYPSSKTCSHCGAEKPLKLSDRIYECNNCDLVIDRDYNASLNIKRVGITQLA